MFDGCSAMGAAPCHMESVWQALHLTVAFLALWQLTQNIIENFTSFLNAVLSHTLPWHAAHVTLAMACRLWLKKTKSWIL